LAEQLVSLLVVQSADKMAESSVVLSESVRVVMKADNLVDEMVDR